MIKKISTGTAFMVCALFFSQVGINTTTPKATLDVVGKPTDILSLDGITAPRITGTQLRSKIYTAAQTGTLIYATAPDTAPEGQTVDVTNIGYYYFNGTKWIKINAEPWQILGSTNAATSNTQNIYQTGKVSIGGNASNGLLSIYNTTGLVNNTSLYIQNTSFLDSNIKPWVAHINNLASGSFSTLSINGDQAFVFSTDNNAMAYSRNALELIPHVGGGGGTPFGFKITEQGMFAFNAQYPTETIDLALGTMRIRSLPKNGATNAIYTTPSGTASLPETTDFAGTFAESAW